MDSRIDIVKISIIWSIFIFLPIFSLNVLSIAFGVDNMELECDISDVLSLSIYLITSNVISLFYILVLSSVLVGYLYNLCYNVKLSYGWINAQFALAGIYLAFLVPWNIVGDVILFRDSGECLGTSVWIMTLLTLISQLIVMFGQWFLISALQWISDRHKEK